MNKFTNNHISCMCIQCKYIYMSQVTEKMIKSILKTNCPQCPEHLLISDIRVPLPSLGLLCPLFSLSLFLFLVLTIQAILVLGMTRLGARFKVIQLLLDPPELRIPCRMAIIHNIIVLYSIPSLANRRTPFWFIL